VRWSASRPAGAIRAGGALALLTLSAPASAFTPAGHKVLEAMAYRELGEGPPSDSEALAYLMRDGEIEAALCLDDASADCLARRETDPLAWWPAPRTDTPDMILARQFDHVGQCFHFMAQRDDESGDHYGNPNDPTDPHVSYGLQWTAYDRCVAQLETVLADIVVDSRIGGPRQARYKARGMYELMHAVTDSYSMAHTERDYDDREPGVDPKIRYLKVWQPTVANPFSDASRNSRHELFEPRDDDFIDRFRVVGGRPCTDYVARPYEMPPSCLSETGELAVGALKDLIHLVVSLRCERHRQAALHGAWAGFVRKHLAHAAQPGPQKRGAPLEYEEIPYLFLGTRVQSVPSQGHVDSTIFARYVLQSGAIDPITFAASVEAGTRESPGRQNRLMLREDVDIALPLGDRVALGMTPFSFATMKAASEVRRGIGESTMEVTSRAVRLDFYEPWQLRRVSFTIWGPVEYAWLEEEFRWSIGVGVSGTLDEHQPGAVTRRSSDPNPKTVLGAWQHPHPWDAELRMQTSWWPPRPGIYLGATSGTSGVGTGPGGKVEEGLELGFLRRNPWGDATPLSAGLLLGAVAIPNSGQPPAMHGAVAATVAVRVRAIGPFGVAGEVGGASPDLAPSQLFGASFQARAGLVVTLGGVDLVVLSPTVPQSAYANGEILTTRIVVEP
jgi:hypothetical protein